MQVDGNLRQNSLFGALTSQASSGQLPNNQVLGKNDFLRLLVTQLSYQDPLEPLSNEEFIAQTAQFSTLEQVQELNETILNQIALQRTISHATAVQYVGKVVEAPGAKLVLAQGQPARLGAKSPEGASVQFDIFDAAGNLASTINLGVQTAQTAWTQWEGRDVNGQLLPDGVYTYQAHAVNELGEPVEIEPIMSGKVSGVAYENEQALLSVNGELISPGDILSVRDSY
jgi:flagellar basal-body rod modification protein FlgD